MKITECFLIRRLLSFLFFIFYFSWQNEHLICLYIIECKFFFSKKERREMPMVEPDVVEKRFKKYIRVSLGNLTINIWKSRKKKNDSELLKSEVFFVEKETSEEYGFLENSVNVMGFNMIIRNDLLYETLKGLEQKHRDIIYLSCCEDWSDMKIGRKFIRY